MVSTSGNQKGGGYGSRQHVEKSVKTGTGSKGTRPGGAESIGKSYGKHVTNKGNDTGYRGPQFYTGKQFQSGVKFGNEVSLNVGKGGPGTGRDIHPAGGQGCHGTPDRGKPGLPSTRGQWPDER
jgi:hypothetical protein